MHLKVIISVLALALIGCGDNDSSNGVQAATMFVNDTSSQPTCGADTNNQLIYVFSEKRFKVCQDSTWTTIDISEKGEKGEKGDPGKGMQISTIYNCPRSENLNANEGLRHGSSTNVVTFSDNSYFMSCDAWIYEDGTYDTSSQSVFWPLDSIGAITDGIISCIPFFVTASFNIKLKQVTYIHQGDSERTETVSCTQSYSNK